MKYFRMDPHTIGLRLQNKVQRGIQRILGKQFVHFLHIGKTGGTAIKDALSAAPGNDAYVLRLRDHEIKFRDVPIGDLVFFFLRDPLSRFVSGFFSRQRQGQPRYMIPWSPEEKLAFNHFHLPNQLGLALSSKDEQERAKARHAMENIYHVRDSYWNILHSEAYLDFRKEDILFIGLQENLGADFEVLKGKLDLAASIVLPTDDVRAHRNPPHVDTSLQEEAAKNLRHWYREDYACIEACRRMSLLRSLGGSIGC